MTRFTRLLSLLLLAGLLLPISAARAQDEQLTLGMRRLFGYGGGGQIQGKFRLEALGPTDLVSATFKMDETVLGTVDAPPFRLDINTDDYPPGWHSYTVEARTADGRSLVSPPRRYQVLTSEQSWQSLQNVLLPVGAVLVVVMLLTLVVPILEMRLGLRKPVPPGTPRSYGWLGGAICPKCARPFPMHWYALRLSLVGRLERCDHCGRWSLVRGASLDQLRAAEAAELAAAGAAAPAADSAHDLKRQLDDSRFMDQR